MNAKPLSLSIIFVYYNTPNEIVKCLWSLKSATKGIDYEIIIVDNNSPTQLPKTITKSKSLTIIHNTQNKGYGKALNQGAKIAKGNYILLANPDIIFLKDSINLLLKRISTDNSVGIIGPQILNQNKKILKVGSDYPFLPLILIPFSFINTLFPYNYFSKKYFLLDLDRTKENEIPALAGACMLVGKTVFNKVKGFDEQFFMYFEEADLCYRIKQIGYKVLFYPKAKIMHFVGRSNSNKAWIQKTFETSRFTFFKKYHGVFPALLAESFLRSLRMIASIL